MTVTAGTVAATSGATTTSLAVTLADTTTGALNVITASVNSTGTGVQPVIATPSGWTLIGDSWRTGSPSHEIASFYRFRQSGDPTSVTVSWTATGNAAIAPIAFSAGMVDTTTPIVSGEASFTNAAGPTTDVTAALSLGGSRYVVSVFGNRTGATWSAASDGNVHDAILAQGTVTSAASVAVCGTGTTTTVGGARSLLSSASSSVQNVGVFALNPASGGGGGGGGSGVSVRGQSSNSGSGTTATVAVPSAAVTGDQVLVAFTQGNTDVLTAAPSTALAGPTVQNSTGSFITKTYVVPVDGTTVTAGSTLTFTMSAARQWSVNALAIAGGASGASLVQFHAESNGNVSNVVMPSLTTTASVFLVELACSKSNGTQVTDFTAPSGWTKQSVQAATTTFGPATVWAVGTAEPYAAGSYGTDTWTPNQTGGAALGFVMGLAASGANTPPTAVIDAPLASARPWATVTHSGAASSDTDGTVASYAWTQTGGTTVTLTGASTASVSYVAPQTRAGTTVTLQLVVTDNSGAASAPVTVTDSIDPVNEWAVVGGVEVPVRIQSV